NSQVSPIADSNFVRALLHTQKNGTWCGTNRGLFLLAGRTKETNYDSWIEIPELEGLSIYALSEDSAGAIWAGTNAGLFVRTDASSNFNRVHSANTVVSIGEENPEDQPSQPTPPVEGENKPAPGPGVGNESPQPPPPATQPRGRVLALANFRGHLYAAFFDRGIERVDGDRRVPVLSGPFAKQATCLVPEGDAALWIGTAKGELWRYDGSGTRSIALPPIQSDEKAVRAIAFEKNRMWIGTSNGLFLRDGDTISEIKSGIEVRGLFPAGDSLFIATKNSGLVKYRRDTEVSIRLDTEQGLASQQVFALASSLEGDILIGTNKGVTRH